MWGGDSLHGVIVLRITLNIWNPRGRELGCGPSRSRSVSPQDGRAELGSVWAPQRVAPSVVWLGQGQTNLGRVFAARGARASLESRDDAVTLTVDGRPGRSWRECPDVQG